MSGKTPPLGTSLCGGKPNHAPHGPMLEVLHAQVAAHKERLAAFAHERWSGWMRWMLECLDSPEREQHLARWRRQMGTPYSELPEGEKESDRKEASLWMAENARWP